MSDSYTKLFASITESTIWQEPSGTRLVWITMLAKCNRRGEVFGSVPGLANLAKVTVDECVTALKTLQSPDPWSRTKEHEGRRIAEIDGGWRLLNHAKFDRLRSEIESEEREIERKRKWDREHRPSGHKRASQSDASPTQSDASPTNSDAPPALALAPKSKSKEQKQAASGFALPGWIPPEAWSGFVEMRKRTRHPLTERAVTLIVNELTRLRADGHEPGAVLDQSTRNGWRDVFPLRDHQQGKSKTSDPGQRRLREL